MGYDQNIAEYYTEPSGPASIIDRRINCGKKIKNMLTPPNEPNEQCKVELASLVGESIGGRKSKTCYPPPTSPMKSVKWKNTPTSPNPRANPRPSNTPLPKLPKINSQYGKF